MQSVKGARLLDAELTGPFKIGYVRLIQFNEPTAEELVEGARRLAEAGHAGAHSRSSEQSRRTVEQRGGCLRAIFAAEHESRFHAGTGRFAAA